MIGQSQVYSFLEAHEISFETLDKPLSYLSNKTFKAEMPEEYTNLLNKLKEKTQ